MSSASAARVSGLGCLRRGVDVGVGGRSAVGAQVELGAAAAVPPAARRARLLRGLRARTRLHLPGAEWAGLLRTARTCATQKFDQ